MAKVALKVLSWLKTLRTEVHSPFNKYLPYYLLGITGVAAEDHLFTWDTAVVGTDEKEASLSFLSHG